jgi:hypothetical protein
VFHGVVGGVGKTQLHQPVGGDAPLFHCPKQRFVTDHSAHLQTVHGIAIRP